MNNLQNEIYKTIDILTDNKLKELKYDRTVRGLVKIISDNDCQVLIDGETYTCKFHTPIKINDVVYVKFPSNNAQDKYIEAVVGEFSGGGTLGNLDGGEPHTIYGGMQAIDGGGIDGS